MKIVSTLLTTTGLVASAQAFVAPTTQGRAEIMTAESSSCSTSTMQQMSNSDETNANCNRRVLLGGFLSAVTTIPFLQPDIASADVDVEDYIRSGMVSMPMGVSGQAGKSKPETGVVLRDGSEVLQDSRSGNVLAEILIQSQDNKVIPVVATFASPWKLATGSLFDVECRDSNTGDGAFLAVTSKLGNGKSSISDLKDSFFIDSLFSPLGRFSFYGQPTDVKVQKSSRTVTKDGHEYRIIDVSFATLSQSTQTEIPRKAQIVATVPDGTSQAVMLVGSSSALRWKKGAEQAVASTIDSFRAIPAPETSMKLREKQRS